MGGPRRDRRHGDRLHDRREPQSQGVTRLCKRPHPRRRRRRRKVSIDQRRRREVMANTDVTQRSQYERSDLLAGGEGIRRGSEKGAAIYSVIALVIGVVLAYAALKTIDNWAQWVV